MFEDANVCAYMYTIVWFVPVSVCVFVFVCVLVHECLGICLCVHVQYEF